MDDLGYGNVNFELDNGGVWHLNGINWEKPASWRGWTGSFPKQQDFDHSIDLTDVNTISIGFGNKPNPEAGGSGKMIFDDIRLYPAPVEE